METSHEVSAAPHHPARGLIMNARVKHDPSRYSNYVSDAFYRELVADFSDWQADDRTVEDTIERDLFRRLVEQEARILDQLLFEQWIQLYAPECIYWVPSTPEGGDPRRGVGVLFAGRGGGEPPAPRRPPGCGGARPPSSRTSR